MNRRLKLNYRKVDVEDLSVWLDDNKIKHAFLPNMADEISGPKGTILVFHPI